MERIFKTGDRVFHYGFGWGEVKGELFKDKSMFFKYSDVDRYVLPVHFDKHKMELFLDEDGIILLSFTQYKLEGFSQERPEPLPKIGQVVWGKNIDQDDWHIGHFHIFDRDSISLKYCISSNPLGGKTLWVQQITAKNPYTNEQ